MKALNERITRLVAQKMSDDVFAKNTTWEKLSIPYEINGDYLRRFCKSLLGDSFKSMERSTLTKMTVSEAKELHELIHAKKVTLVQLGLRYGVSDTAVKKRLMTLLGSSYENSKGPGTEMVLECVYCGKKFARLDYSIRSQSQGKNFCSQGCSEKWNIQHLSKGFTTDKEWFDFYQKNAEKLSLRGMATQLGMTHSIFSKHLHNSGILEAPISIIDNYKLKPFIQKF